MDFFPQVCIEKNIFLQINFVRFIFHNLAVVYTCIFMRILMFYPQGVYRSSIVTQSLWYRVAILVYFPSFVLLVTEMPKSRIIKVRLLTPMLSCNSGNDILDEFEIWTFAILLFSFFLWGSFFLYFSVHVLTLYLISSIKYLSITLYWPTDPLYLIRCHKMWLWRFVSSCLLITYTLDVVVMWYGQTDNDLRKINDWISCS